jgi:hypothetical protein
MTLTLSSLDVCNTISLGIVARQILRESPTLTLCGHTSRGLFLVTPHQKIIFISYETYRGPLTLNVDHELHGDTAQIIDSHLLLGDTAIPLETANLWQPNPAPQNLVSLAQQIATLQHFLERAQIVIPSEARNLFDNPRDSSSHTTLLGMTHLAKSLILNLGKGSGLTPSHDDIAIGFLLTLNRYGHCPHNDLIINEARARTTTLSANLIECATLGLADERLIRVIDCLFTGDKNNNALDELFGWGESSGLHALLGMSLAIHDPLSTDHYSLENL